MAISDLIIRIALSTVLGGLIGLEREWRDQPAGFRTHLLVCLGSTVFTLVSIHGFDALVSGSPLDLSIDPTRVAAQIVVGVGFLGAGAIIRQGVSVHGLTTAASLWTMAALGMVVGLGWYTLAAILTIAVVVSLTLLLIVERKLVYPRTRNNAYVEVFFKRDDTGERGEGGALAALTAVLDDLRVEVVEIRIEEAGGQAGMARMRLRIPAQLRKNDLLQELARNHLFSSIAVR